MTELKRQLGYELLSIFKGAPTDAIDQAVDRVLYIVRHPSGAVDAGKWSPAECPACGGPISIIRDGKPDDYAGCGCTIVSLEWLRLAANRAAQSQEQP